MPRNKDVLWEYIIQDGRKVKCKFCSEVFVGGVTRMRYHFANTCSKDIRPCKAVPESVQEVALKGVIELELKSKKRKVMSSPKAVDSSLGPIVQAGDASVDVPQEHRLRRKNMRALARKAGSREADKAIVKYVVNNNLPFSVLQSLEFHEACIAIANAGPGYEPPSSAFAWTRLLTELKDEADVYVHSVKRIWDKSGCTLMLDSWTEGRDMSYLSLFAASPKGVVYLKSLCTVGHTTDDQYIFEFVSSVIDEIGSRNVVQFILGSNLNYASIGHMIEEKYPNIFKVNCAAHSINLMLKELGNIEHVYAILEGAKKIVNFVCKHQQVLNLIRTQTNGCEMKRPSATRFSTNFIYLRSLLKEEHTLRLIVGTAEWRDLTPCRSIEGMEVQNMIQEGYFWDCAKELVAAVEPLVKVLRMVDSCGSTSGYLHDAICKVKEAIKEAFRGEDVKYQPFWKIIDDKWNNFLYCDMYAAAAYLNPHLFHDGHVKLDSQVKVGLEKVIQRMVSTNDERMRIAEELRDYHLLDPRIFGVMAVESLHVSHPRIWWDMWGSSVPILQSLAIKVLSQPCSFLTCEKNWSALEATHSKKRGQLDAIRLQDLLYVRMNMHLMKAIPKTEKADSKPIDVDKIEAFPDELEGIGLHEDRENANGKDEEAEEEEELGEESENEFGILPDVNGCSFSGIV